jgi:AcrR family transcriptional regulator
MEQREKRPYRRAAETRHHILEVASRLFYAEGIHTVGIDRIASEAEVTTTTLYRLFGSKDGLVAAYVCKADEAWFEKLERAVAKGGLIELFDQLDAEARDASNRGCVFRLALTEYPDGACDVHCLALDNKRRTRERFKELLAASGHREPDVTADKLMLIMDGMEASASDRSPEDGPGPGPALVRDLLGATSPA